MAQCVCVNKSKVVPKKGLSILLYSIGTSTLLIYFKILSCFSLVVFGLSMLQQTRFVNGFNVTQVTTIQYSVVL